MSGAALTVIRDRVRTAHEQRTPLRLRGAGTKDFYGERLEGEVLDLSAYDGIVDYEPAELVVTARCGTRLAELEQELLRHGQFLGFEPPSFGGEATVGGTIATGLSGPRRIYAGAARDFVLGAMLLDVHGEALRFGGRVMKNVAGFDVARLLTGSLGILGPVLEVSLRVLPCPRAELTLRLELDAPAAIAAFNAWAGEPLPVSATAWHAGLAWVRLSGAEPAIESAERRIGGERVAAGDARAWWNALRDGRRGMFTQSSGTLWRLALPSSTPPLPLPGEMLIEWGGGLRWHAGIPPEVDVRAQAQAAGGSALRWRGDGPQQRFHPLSALQLEIHRRLKQHFDPHGIFNRGRLVQEL